MVVRKKPGDEVTDYVMQDLESGEEPKKKKKKGLDPEFLKDMAAGKVNTDAPKKEENMSSEASVEAKAQQAGIDPDLAKESAMQKLQEQAGNKTLNPDDPNVQKSVAEQMQKDLDSSTSSMTTEQKEELVAKSKEDDSGANMPAQRSDAPGAAPEDKPAEEKPPEEEGQSMWGWDNFKDALSYFGPRMGAMLIGGPGAMELTDQWLKGIDDKAGTPAQQARQQMEQQKLELAQKRLALGQQESQRKGAQFQQSMEFQKERAAAPSEKFLESIAAKETVMQHSQHIQGLLDRVGSKMIGPAAGRFNSLKVKAGIGDKDFAKLEQSTGKILVDYVKSVSGQQVSDKEAQRLSNIMFSVNDSMPMFKAKLENFNEILQSEFETLSKVYKSGKPLTKQNIDRIVEDINQRLNDRITSKKDKASKEKQSVESPEQDSSRKNILNKYGIQ